MERTRTRITSFEELLSSDKVLVYTNIGTSMLPLLRERRDVIEIRKKAPGRCKRYDVVLYKRGVNYVLHRILKVLPDGYVIAGDHNIFLETDIKDDNILGVMTRVIRNGRSISITDWKYRIYVHLWCDLYPIRARILYVKIRVRGIGHKMKKALLRNGSESND